MKTKKIGKALSLETIEFVKQYSDPRVYQTEAEIIYEGQIPNAGYVVVDGEIFLYKKRKIIHSIKEGTVFGVTELMNNNPFDYTAKIKPYSTVCILDKSTVKDILENMQNPEHLELV